MLKLIPVPLPKVTGFGAETPSVSMTLSLSAMLALNGTLAAPRLNSRPLPALKVSVAWPVPKSVMVGSLLGSVIGLAYIYLARKDPGTYELPFGTFLGAGAILIALLSLR